MLSRSFISFDRGDIRGALLGGRILRACPRLAIVGDVSGSCKIPKLHLKVTTSSSGRVVSCLQGGVTV